MSGSGLPMPDIDPWALDRDRARLDRALDLVGRASDLVGTALDQPPHLADGDLVASWRAAVTARGQDLADLAEVLEHARNVLGKTAATVEGSARKHARAWTGRRRDAWVEVLVDVVALGSDQYIRMAEVDVADVPLDPPVPGRPLEERHVVPAGVVRARTGSSATR